MPAFRVRVGVNRDVPSAITKALSAQLGTQVMCQRPAPDITSYSAAIPVNGGALHAVAVMLVALEVVGDNINEDLGLEVTTCEVQEVGAT